MSPNGEKCVSMAIIASIIYISLVSGLPIDKRRESDLSKTENLLNMFRLLKDMNYNSGEAQQTYEDKRFSLDFGTGRNAAAARVVKHLKGLDQLNEYNNPGKRRNNDYKNFGSNFLI